MFNLLASRGLFAALIVITVIVVALCIGLVVMLIVRPLKVKDTIEADAVRKELYRRETELVIRILAEKTDAKIRDELIEGLRRVKTAETLVDEIIRAEKAERGIADKPNGAAKSPAGKAAPARNSGEVRKPVPAPANGNVGGVKAEAAAATAKDTPAAVKPAEQKPVLKEDSGENKSTAE